LIPPTPGADHTIRDLSSKPRSGDVADLWSPETITDKTDLGLILGAFSALAYFIGPVAALVLIAFVAGRLSTPRDK